MSIAEDSVQFNTMKYYVVRISIGRFDSNKIDTVKRALDAAEDKLAPGIRTMKENRGFFAGIDGESYSMVNVSFWDSVAAAKQMEQFQPMLELAKEFIGIGVRFERPILNFEPLWTIEQKEPI
ncbi:MAG TPA: hypothetical protein VED17_07600 [Nitrososphaerales archaeon]|nr:hypothetical protein [Nitrososphaerales archaeon]